MLYKQLNYLTVPVEHCCDFYARLLHLGLLPEGKRYLHVIDGVD